MHDFSIGGEISFVIFFVGARPEGFSPILWAFLKGVREMWCF
jgi:hypothetical protein